MARGTTWSEYPVTPRERPIDSANCETVWLAAREVWIESSLLFHSRSDSRARRRSQITARSFSEKARAAHSAMASAAVSDCLLRCVMREEARTKVRRRCGSLAKNAPMIALRMAGPAPADLTADLVGGNPSQSLMQARAVARPTPAGSAMNHHRSFQARVRWKRAASVG